MSEPELEPQQIVSAPQHWFSVRSPPRASSESTQCCGFGSVPFRRIKNFHRGSGSNLLLWKIWILYAVLLSTCRSMYVTGRGNREMTYTATQPSPLPVWGIPIRHVGCACRVPFQCWKKRGRRQGFVGPMWEKKRKRIFKMVGSLCRRY